MFAQAGAGAGEGRPADHRREPARSSARRWPASTRRRQDDFLPNGTVSRCRCRSTRSTAAPAERSRPTSSSRLDAARRRGAARWLGARRPTVLLLQLADQRPAARGDLRAHRGRLLADLRLDQASSTSRTAPPSRSRRTCSGGRSPSCNGLAGRAAAGHRGGGRLRPGRWSASSIGRSSGTRASFFTVFIAAFGVQIVVQNADRHGLRSRLRDSDDAASAAVSRSCRACSSRRSRRSRSCVGAHVLRRPDVFLTRTQVGIGYARAVGEPRPRARVRPRSRTRLAQVCVRASARRWSCRAPSLTAMTAGLNPAIGAHVMLISLAATIVGGIGSLRGAACGGLLLGLAENLALWKLDPQWSEGRDLRRPVRVHHLPSGGLLRPPAGRQVRHCACWPTSSTWRC